MNISRAGILLTVFLLVSGCSGSGNLTVDSIKRAVYQMPEVGKITFTEGYYYPEENDLSGQSFTRLGHVDLFAFGDLNGDGTRDAVTFVARYERDGKIFLSMEVVLNKSGTPVHTVSYLLGDRVAIDHIAIADGEINLNIITQGPNDAICCPTLHVSKALRLQDGELHESTSAP